METSDPENGEAKLELPSFYKDGFIRSFRLSGSASCQLTGHRGMLEPTLVTSRYAEPCIKIGIPLQGEPMTVWERDHYEPQVLRVGQIAIGSLTSTTCLLEESTCGTRFFTFFVRPELFSDIVPDQSAAPTERMRRMLFEPDAEPSVMVADIDISSQAHIAAFAVGYRDPSFFTKVYKKYRTRLPSAFHPSSGEPGSPYPPSG